MNKMLTALCLGALLGFAGLSLPACSSTQERVQLPTTYRMQEGDTLKSIAQRYYGSETGWVRIYRANQDNLPNADAIRIGLELVIPAPAGPVNPTINDEPTPSPSSPSPSSSSTSNPEPAGATGEPNSDGA